MLSKMKLETLKESLVVLWARLLGCGELILLIAGPISD